ncbi:MAG: peptide chain release factor 1 [Candidatus Aenigmarchaeota archaeon ex4484_224]|nr:MAG: peptide chain release factor 1 [Candidatus Aenigmarchaeota archaeon ex4484_224]
MVKMNEEEKIKLKKLIKELEKIRGRHTELVSVYIPAGYNLVDVINQLRQEQSTAENIKSKTTRKNVLAALEKILQHLKLYRKTPDNGLVIFAGNVSEVEGRSDIRLWAIIPPEPLDTKIYWCDQVFVLEPLKEMVAEKEIYGLIVLDGKEASIGLLKGKKIVQLKKIDSFVPSKTIKGGMCVSEDTLILLDNGQIIPIKNLKNNHKILSYSFEKFKPIFTDSFEIFKRKPKEAYKIFFSFPSFSITLTPEHKIFVVNKNGIEEKFVEDLKIGDRVLFISQIKLQNKNYSKKSDRYLFQLLGYMLGDGSFYKNRIQIYDKDLDLIKKYASIVKRIVKKEPKILKRRNTYELRIYSKKFLSFIQKNYTEIVKKSRERDIPSIILQLPNSILKFFIRGLFDAEGYVDKKTGIGIRMTNEKIIRKLHLLFLRFGIVASLRGPDKHQRYELRITNPIFLKQFYLKIGFGSEKKNKKLKEILREPKHSLSFSVPINGIFLRKILEKNGIRKEHLKRYGMFLSGKRGISYPVFRKLVGEIKKLNKISPNELKLLNLFLSSSLISPIVKKKIKIKTKKTFYDLYIPNFNCFIANGLVVHNSQRRYDRIREDAMNQYLKKVGEISSKIFEEIENLKGVIIGGPGPVKEMFYDGDYLKPQIKQKVLGVKDTGYTGRYGLEELVKRSDDLLEKAAIMKEKKLLNRFFKELRMDGKVVYGFENTIKALQAGAIEILLISEDFEYIKAKFVCNKGHEKEIIMRENEKKEVRCDICGERMNLVDKKEILDEIEEIAKQFSTKIEFISTDTNEGKQFKALGGIGGILRFKIE